MITRRIRELCLARLIGVAATGPGASCCSFCMAGNLPGLPWGVNNPVWRPDNPGMALVGALQVGGKVLALQQRKLTTWPHAENLEAHRPGWQTLCQPAARHLGRPSPHPDLWPPRL